GIGAVVVLQLLFTYAPPLQRLFDNEPIPLWVWPWLVTAGLVFFLVVEAEKLCIRSSGSLRRAVTGVEAGPWPLDPPGPREVVLLKRGCPWLNAGGSSPSTCPTRTAAAYPSRASAARAAASSFFFAASIFG